jgi:hypothetical protein
LKGTLLQSLMLLPENSLVGLITFGFSHASLMPPSCLSRLTHASLTPLWCISRLSRPPPHASLMPHSCLSRPSSLSRPLGKNVHIHELSFDECPKSYVFRYL